MSTRLGGSLLLGPGDVAPSRDDFEVVGVFNPGAAVVDGEVVLLVRVAERPRGRREGYTPLPRFEPGRGMVIDWTPTDALDVSDPRVVKRKDDGTVRLTSISHLRVVRCGDGGRSGAEETGYGFLPEWEIEEFGVEDPRVTAVAGRFWFTYVAVSRHGPATALASTADFRTFTRHGVIFCVENKDVVLFPEPLGGEFVALHRPVGGTPFTAPEVWVARSPDLLHWGGHAPLSWPAGEWETGRVGAGPPPLRTADGWLAVYHGNRKPTSPGGVGAYAAGALLLDLDDPSRVMKRTPAPFFGPAADYERRGFVPDVVFPTGVVADGDSLRLYYGAADSGTAVAEFSLAGLLASLR